MSSDNISSVINKDIVSVERCVDDLRRGLPVVVDLAKEGRFLVAASECVAAKIVQLLETFSDSGVFLLVAAERIKAVFKNNAEFQSVSASSYILERKYWNLSDIRFLCGLDDKGDWPDSSYFKEFSEDNGALLKLAKITELLPSVLFVKLQHAEISRSSDFSKVSKEQIENYSKHLFADLEKICEANLTLKEAREAKIVGFRPQIGGREHYAIIVGNPDPNKEVLVRIHSSCYTGDLLASLSCDCRDQLQSALKLMAEGEGGIIVYLLQEGRGIGLPNKLRAYALKEQGYDTVEANQMLGFSDDERPFVLAANILKQLGIIKVKILSNNPRKASELAKCGIEITECIAHKIAGNEYTSGYLKTKADKLGHKF